MTDPRYPIGRFSPDLNPTSETRARHIEEIAGLPSRMRRAVSGLNQDQINTPYRDGGWTVQQVVHHVADSHLNAYVRFKLTMTADTPTINPYDEVAWAQLQDTQGTPIEVSVSLLESLHTRWIVLLKSLHAEDFHRKFNHPESGIHDADWLLALYAWHGKHHLTHITSLRERMKW
jgi:hypothetical protein